MTITPADGRRGGRARGVPILMYHSLDDSGSPISMEPGLFRSQIRSLHEGGYRVLSVSALVAEWSAGGPSEGRTVALTFDDGFANVVEEGVQVLGELGFSATIFVVAGHLGGCNDWSGQSVEIPRLPLLSAARLRELAGSGFEVGCHSLTHPVLRSCDGSAAQREIVESKERLEEVLGQPVRTFAYPYGVAGAAQREMVARHYDAACGTELRWARVTDDRWNLPRLEMYYWQRPEIRALMERRWGRMYLRGRGWGRRARVALEGWGLLGRTTPTTREAGTS